MEHVVNPTEMPLEERDDTQAGLVRSQLLLRGKPGSPEDFELSLSHTSGSFSKPVQRQAFHQIRFQLKGEAEFETGGRLRQGCIAYLPGGVWYGPLAVAGDSAAVVLKFGHQEAEAAVLTAGDEAPPQAAAPTLLDPAQFDWVEDAVVPGVRRKFLGRVSERGAAVHLLRIDEGAAAQLAPFSVLFVLQGAGRAPGSAWYRYAAIRSDDNPGSLTATEASELLEIELPALPTPDVTAAQDTVAQQSASVDMVGTAKPEGPVLLAA